MIELYPHQLEALKKIKNGSILKGDVGSGKSLTALSYYYLQEGGDIAFLKGGWYTYMNEHLKDLYIITVAKKRDDLEWEKEMAPFLLSTHEEKCAYKNTVVVDSWQNIIKYTDVKDAFFIFDEQRAVGKGVWAKSFIKIARKNNWIMLSATPGDKWEDFIPVFIAHGFFRNRTEFNDEHVIFKPGIKYPVVMRYLNEGRLLRMKNDILVKMKDERKTVSHHINIPCEYDIEMYLKVYKDRWNPFDECPIENISQYCYLLRKVVNLDESRQSNFLQLVTENAKTIVFYNFNYELALITSILPDGYAYGEWNGRRHDPIPSGEKWVYLVQYSAGSEGWNCTETDTMIFYSQNYSYKMLKQAAGRIDRMNTPFKDLYYYHLTSRSSIDRRIEAAQRQKKKFNEREFASHFERRKDE